MKVILLEDIKGTGKKGDVKEVNDGFAKNFLLKNKKAVVADSVNLNNNKQAKEADDFHEQERINKAKEDAKILNNKEIIIYAKIGSNGKLFGAITNKEIADEINKVFNFNLEKRQVLLNENYKAIGRFTFDVKLYKNISCKMVVNIKEQA